jgi:hypothetical protein
MGRELVPDAPWEVIEPLLPAPRTYPCGDALRLPHRAARTGILFVLKTGIQ